MVQLQPAEDHHCIGGGGAVEHYVRLWRGGNLEAGSFRGQDDIRRCRCRAAEGEAVADGTDSRRVGAEGPPDCPPGGAHQPGQAVFREGGVPVESSMDVPLVHRQLRDADVGLGAHGFGAQPMVAQLLPIAGLHQGQYAVELAVLPGEFFQQTVAQLVP